MLFRSVEASHRLFGLDLFTGKVELSQPAMPNAGEDELAPKNARTEAKSP